MSDLPSGLYDALITLALERRLEHPDLTVLRSEISADTAAEALARHVFHLAAAVLSSLPGRGPEKVARQVAFAIRRRAPRSDGSPARDTRKPALLLVRPRSARPGDRPIST